MAVSVLLLSNDPLLGPSLEALARGRLRVRHLEPSRRSTTWPGRATSTVVLDLAAGERATAYSWVREHHAGPVIVLLRPDEQASSLPPDPDRLVLRRPLSLSYLVETLSGLDSTNSPANGVPSRGAPQPTPGQKPAEPDLLQASARQRGLRLGSLSRPAGDTPTATPGALVAGTAGGAMPATEPAAQAAPPVAPPEERSPGRAASAKTASHTEATEPATRPTANGHRQAAQAPPQPSRPPEDRRPATRPKRRPERRRSILARGVVLGALGVVMVSGVWLALGLLQARKDLGVEGAGLRSELAKAHAALGRGDPDGARTAIRAASRNLDAAEAITVRRPMRVAARLPLLGGGVSDVRHLLAAARNLTGAADRAVAVSVHLQSGRFAVLEHGRFDLEALDRRCS